MENYKIIHQKIYVDKNYFLSDPIYILTNTEQKKKQYLYDLAKDKNLAIKQVVNNLMKFSDHFILTEEKPGEAQFKFYQNKIVVGLPPIDMHRIATLVGASVLYSLKNKTDINERIILNIVPVFVRVLAKNMNRSIDTSIVQEELSWYLYAWFLHVIQNLTVSSFLGILNMAGTKVPEEGISEIISTVRRGIDSTFSKLCKILGSEEAIVKQKLIVRYGIDFLIGLEDIIHTVAVLSESSAFKIPSALYSEIPEKQKIYFKDMVVKVLR